MAWLEVLLGFVIGLLVNECTDMAPWAAKRLMQWAVHRRYRQDRVEVCGQELAALIDGAPGRLVKLVIAMGFAALAATYWVGRAAARSAKSGRALLLHRKVVAAAMVTLAVCLMPYMTTLFPVALAAPALIAFNEESQAPATSWLLETAARLRLASGSSSVVAAATDTTYIHLQRWALDTTSIHGQVIMTHDERSWRLPDRSGHTISCGVAQSPDGTLAGGLSKMPGLCAQERVEYPPGSFPVVLETEPSTDFATLRAQLATGEPPDRKTQSTLRAIAAIAAYHHLDTSQRAAVLEVMADLPNLLHRGAATDRAGRAGFAFSIDSGGPAIGRVRDIVVLDANGQVLGHEIVALSAPPQLLDIEARFVMAYQLFLEAKLCRHPCGP